VNLLDLVLVGLALIAAWGGWRQGLIGGVLSFVGFIGGALVGAVLAPHLLGDITGFLGLALAVLIVVVAAGIGNAVAAVLGTWIRGLVTWHPARVVDSAGGSMFGILTVAVVAWVVASAIVVVPLGSVSTQVRGSLVLGEIDQVLPETTRDWVSGLRSALDSTGLPQAFSGFTVDPDLPIDEPDPALLKDPAVRRAWGSLVKVQGIARECGTQVDGSGFVYAPDRVMTNAHVVAGVDRPEVLVRGTGQVWPARVVYIDPKLDVAVLSVPGLSAPQLTFAGTARRGDPAVVAGFPGGGPLTATPARIRGTISARGTDIYGRGKVTREVYAVRGTIRPGNSGGPLLAPDGKVDGVVFATSVDDPDTGYALTAKQVATAARDGAAASTRVDTGSCATR
jgi:S1-C subfamily serine protease